MNAVVPLRTITPSTYDERSLALIRRTVAADCNEDEFNLFIHMARHLRLDPLRRQIYAFVYNKTNAAKRRMSIITAIDGFRTIADRTGNYRPDEDEATIEVDDALVGPSNPAGLIKATVRVFKFSHGAWHRVTASAYWEEYAPLKQGWSETVRVDTGERWPDGNTKYRVEPAPDAENITTLDTSGNWGKMPRVMLAKVAEALALRKAWPDDFANVYAAEEVDRVRAAEMLPAEAAAEGATTERMGKVGAGQSILIDWMNKTPLDAVPIGKLADRIFGFIKENAEEPAAVAAWQDRNRHALREFWARSPGDALEVKKAIEKSRAALTSDADGEP